MSEYTLSNSAAVIDAAISSVAGADATPTDGSQNMVTSSGVKTYVDGTVGVFAGKTVTTEATGIGNTDNDTSIPTSAAVVDYVGSEARIKYATFTAANGSTSVTSWLPLVENQDPDNIATVSGGIIKPTEAGLYAFSWSGNVREDDNDTSDYFTVTTVFASTNIISVRVNEQQFDTTASYLAPITNTNTNTGIYLQPNVTGYYYTTMFWQNVKATLIKLA